MGKFCSICNAPHKSCLKTFAVTIVVYLAENNITLENILRILSTVTYKLLGYAMPSTMLVSKTCAGARVVRLAENNISEYNFYTLIIFLLLYI